MRLVPISLTILWPMLCRAPFAICAMSSVVKSIEFLFRILISTSSVIWLGALPAMWRLSQMLSNKAFCRWLMPLWPWFWSSGWFFTWMSSRPWLLSSAFLWLILELDLFLKNPSLTLSSRRMFWVLWMASFRKICQASMSSNFMVGKRPRLRIFELLLKICRKSALKLALSRGSWCPSSMGFQIWLISSWLWLVVYRLLLVSWPSEICRPLSSTSGRSISLSKTLPSLQVSSRVPSLRWIGFFRFWMSQMKSWIILSS